MNCDLKVTSVICRCKYVAHLLLWGTVVWTIHDGRVRHVKYKGNDRRVNSVPKKRHDGRVRNHFLKLTVMRLIKYITISTARR